MKNFDIRTATIGRRIRRHNAAHRLADRKLELGQPDDCELRIIALQAIAGIPDLGGSVLIDDELETGTPFAGTHLVY
jgi:hypothetical protein